MEHGAPIVYLVLGAGVGVVYLVVLAGLLRSRGALERLERQPLAGGENILAYVDRVIDRELATALRESADGCAALDDVRAAVARNTRLALHHEFDHQEFQRLLERMIQEKLAAERRALDATPVPAPAPTPAAAPRPAPVLMPAPVREPALSA